MFVSLPQAHARPTTMGIENTVKSPAKGGDALPEAPTEGGGKEEGKWGLAWQRVCCPLILVTLGTCP